MDEEMLKGIAEQLKRPEGEYGIRVGEKMNEGNLHINRITIEALQPSPGESILEIGMGNGFFVKDILSAGNGIRYTGCDLSATMIEEANRRNEHFVSNGQASFHLANAEKLPFENENFNKVLSVNTIYFWDNQQLVLSEIWRVLKPQGLVFISIRPESVMKHYPFTRYGFKLFGKNELTKLLSENNFNVTLILEKEEPPQEMNGDKLNVETLLVCAQKP